MKRPRCVGCGVGDRLVVVRAWCAICEPQAVRCKRCHDRHRAHVGVVLVARGPAGAAYRRAPS